MRVDVRSIDCKGSEEATGHENEGEQICGLSTAHPRQMLRDPTRAARLSRTNVLCYVPAKGGPNKILNDACGLWQVR